jgi:hypothetical protein
LAGWLVGWLALDVLVVERDEGQGTRFIYRDRVIGFRDLVNFDGKHTM